MRSNRSPMRVSQAGRRVLGTVLNCSESGRSPLRSQPEELNVSVTSLLMPLKADVAVDIRRLQIGATSGCEQLQHAHLYSITSSARTSSLSWHGQAERFGCLRLAVGRPSQQRLLLLSQSPSTILPRYRRDE